MSDPGRILIRGVNWLGDAVMTTPAVIRLRERFPNAHLVMLCPAKLEGLWRHHPAIDEVLPVERDSSVFATAKRIRAGRFDAAVILPNSPRSALESWLARVPVRVGYARSRAWLLTHPVPARAGAVRMRKRTPREIQRLIQSGARTREPEPPPAAHQIHEYLWLVGSLGADTRPVAPQIQVLDAEVEAVRKRFGLEDAKRPVFALNPGAEYGPAKRWPLSSFAEAAREIQRTTGCVWLILGGSADRPAASELETAVGRDSLVRNIAGETSLRELCAVLKLVRVLLTNDTGPMHVAAAVGTPVVVPFGSTSPELTGPGLPGDSRHALLKSTVPCAPCFLRECPIDFRCMNGIRPQTVVDAVLRVASGPA
ncbi:MAG TPA: lipopolysaccharide heptosyltransferase II [Verrucomicrobia bacterium]|nr:lipopolysaccharide heptosyltransferase II [Verrucomicrobiota bacterium]HOP95881.1 lipopolysaccharide heptosyltransferase II [Verrucomicrobiota bacterium]